VTSKDGCAVKQIDLMFSYSGRVVSHRLSFVLEMGDTCFYMGRRKFNPRDSLGVTYPNVKPLHSVNARTASALRTQEIAPALSC
jgi:hypothetical protein